MSRHLGGKQTILKFVMRIHLKIRGIFISWMGEGIRYELVAFTKTIESGRNLSYVNEDVSNGVCKVIGDFYSRTDSSLI